MKKDMLLALGIGLLLLLRPNVFAQPLPHHFSGIARAPDGTVTLILDGSVSNLIPGLTGMISNQFMQMFDLYPVEASGNLTDWTRLDCLERTNNDPNPLLFRDENAASFSERFYRTSTNLLVTGFPKPTGPFAVGTVSRILTDASRSNRYGIRTNSSFMSTFWYPTEPPKAGSIPSPYTDRAVAGDRNWYNFWGWPLAWTNVVAQCVTHAFPGTPLTSGTNRFPVILHSHGFTCDRTLHSYNAEELASHGYIVAAVDHEDCHATVFPDERGVRYVPPSISNVKGTLFSSRTNDLVYLLRTLEEIDAGDATLAGCLDLTRIGVMGHSMGGGTAAEICRLDSRVKCAALLDPFMFFNYGFNPGLNQQGLQKPFLSMNRTVLDHSNLLWDASGDSQRLYTLATHDATWLTITNTGHFAFSDWAWSVEMTSDSRRGAEAIKACLVWFFDTYLKGQAPPFPTNPEIINVRRK